MQGERSGYGTFPGMAETAADLNAKPLTPEQVQKAVFQVPYLFNQQRPVAWALKDKGVMALRVAARHEAAKKILIEQGRPKERVDGMPHFQVALLVVLQQYDKGSTS